MSNQDIIDESPYTSIVAIKEVNALNLFASRYLYCVQRGSHVPYRTI